MLIISRSLRSRLLAPILTPAAALVLRPAVAFAAATGGGTMPWDTPLQTLRTDLTGGTATSISFIGIVAIFAVLIFGGELNHFFRSLCYVVMLVAVLVGAQNIFSALGIAGTTIDGHNGASPWILAAGFVGLIVIFAALVIALGVLLRVAGRRGRRAA